MTVRIHVICIFKRFNSANYYVAAILEKKKTHLYPLGVCQVRKMLNMFCSRFFYKQVSFSALFLNWKLCWHKYIQNYLIWVIIYFYLAYFKQPPSFTFTLRNTANLLSYNNKGSHRSRDHFQYNWADNNDNAIPECARAQWTTWLWADIRRNRSRKDLFVCAKQYFYSNGRRSNPNIPIKVRTKRFSKTCCP